MSIRIFLTLPLLALSGMAHAEMGGRTDRDEVRREIEVMQRDGRWERAIAEGRANREAFERLRASQTGAYSRQPSRSGQRTRQGGRS